MANIARHVTHRLVALEGSTSCREAARCMAEENVGAVVVLEGGQVVGLVSERELVRRVLADGERPELPIRAAIGRELPVVRPETSEEECLGIMRDHGSRHLLVSEGGEVTGIVSMRDLIQLMLEEKEWMIGQLQSFIDGHDGPRAAAG